MPKVLDMFRSMHAKNTLKYAFNAANLYIGNRLSNGKEARRYPKIHDVTINEHFTRYVFTLLNGMDPKDVAKKEYVFKQVFGESIELKGELKKYVLTIYKRPQAGALPYSFANIGPALVGKGLPIVCGRDINGNWMVYDAITEPNCLISGEPGAGKSTQLRSILTTLIQHKTADELHLYLGDLKMSEFHLFKRVGHVKSVCVYPEDLAVMLSFLAIELKKRSETLNKHGVTHVDKLPAETKPPYILLCIDEIVMIMDDKEMRKIIVQLVSLGRALGIYVILSLQRPSHDILDTKIRSLLTVRMGFRTTDASNAKIIGTPGSERISKTTPGRFVIKRDELTELQAPYLSEENADKTLDAYRIDDWNNRFVDGPPPQPPAAEPEILTEKDVFIDGPY